VPARERQPPSPSPVLIPIDQLKDHPRNYREHPEDQLDHIESSIRQFGFYRSVVASSDHVILAGHGVVKASRRMGLVHVPTIVLKFASTDRRALKILAGDNEISHMAEIDDRMLSEILREVRDGEERNLAGTGYSDEALKALLMVTRPASEIRDFDEASHWVGMPAYDGSKRNEHKTILIFANEEDQRALERKLGIKPENVTYISGHTRSVPWPLRQKSRNNEIAFEDAPAAATPPAAAKGARNGA
jgi:hypothetical protein